MEYSPEFKKNHSTAYLAEEYERLSIQAQSAEHAAGGDAELMMLAEDDKKAISERQAQILDEIEQMLEKDKEEAQVAKAIVLEFRAVAGGDEATLFARELKDMYEKYAEAKGWRVRVI